MSNPESIFHDIYPSATATKVTGTLRALGLPLPLKNELYTGHAPILFCNPFGLAIRFNNPQRFPLMRHENLMRPIGALHIDPNCRMEFQFMATPERHSHIAEKVVKQLSHDGVIVEDVKSSPENMLRLPLCSAQFPQGVPVVYDPANILGGGALRHFEKRFKKGAVMALRPLKGEAPDIQDQCFDHLRQAFETAASAALRKKPNAFTGFLASCVTAKHDGLLRDSANIAEYCNVFPTRAAQAYEQHLWDECQALDTLTQ